MFVKDSINTFIVRCAAYVFAFLVSITISNLGQEVKGQAAIVFFLADLIRLITMMGYEVAIVYYLRQGKYDYDTVTRNLNGLIPILIVGWTIVLFPLFYYLHSISLFGEIDFALIASCFVLAPAGALLNVQIGIFLGMGEITRANKVSLAFNLLYLVLLLAAVLLAFADTWSVIVAYGSAFIASGVMGVLMNWHRSKGQRGFALDKDIIVNLGSYGLRSQLGAFTRKMANRVDLFLTNFYATAFLAGIYSVALNWAELTLFIPMTLYYVLFPHASGRKKDASVDLTNRVSRVSVFTLAVMSVAICLVFPVMEKIIYKPDYSDAIYPLLVVMPGAIFMGVFRVLMGGIDGLGKPQYSTYASIVAVVSTIILNIVLIPRYGMIGAATATSISGLVAFAIVAGYYRRMSNARWSEFLMVRGADISMALTSLRDAILKRGRD